MFVSLSVALAARSFGGDPPPGVRHYKLRHGCPICEGGYLIESAEEFDKRVVGSLIFEAVDGGTEIRCTHCPFELERFPDLMEATEGAFPKILAGRVAASGKPLKTLARVPFLPRGKDVILTGASASWLARAISSLIIDGGREVLYIGNGPEGAACVAAHELLPEVIGNPMAWLLASRPYRLVVIDDLSTAAAAAGLNVGRMPEHWQRFHQALVEPCKDYSAVVMVDLTGLPAKRPETAIVLSVQDRSNGVGVVCERARPVGCPFKVGDQWFVRDSSDGLVVEAVGVSAEPSTTAPSTTRAERFLRELLATGERWRDDAIKAAKAEGITERTLRRAREEVAYTRRLSSGKTIWGLKGEATARAREGTPCPYVSVCGGLRGHEGPGGGAEPQKPHAPVGHEGHEGREGQEPHGQVREPHGQPHGQALLASERPQAPQAPHAPPHTPLSPPGYRAREGVVIELRAAGGER